MPILTRRPSSRTLLTIGLLALVAASSQFVLISAAFTGSSGNLGNSFSALASFPDFPQSVAADNPSAYYRGDDATGSSVAADSSAASVAGVYTSPVQTFRTTPGALGNGTVDPATTFTGAPAGAYANDATSAPTTFTLEIWFRTTSTTNQRIFGFADVPTGNSTTADRFIRMTTLGTVAFNTGPTVITSTGSFRDGAWHLATASLGAAGTKFYVDGVSVGTNAATTSSTPYPGYWRMGGDNSNYLVGGLDEAAVYTTQLSDARVAAHYAAGTSATTLADYTSSVTADNPWALWHLDDPSLTTYQDTGFVTPMADSGGLNHPGTYHDLRPRGLTGGAAGALVGTSAASTSIHFTGAGFGTAATLVTNPQTFSLEVWFRTATTNGGHLIGFSDNTGFAGPSFDRIAFMRNDGKIDFGTSGAAANYVTSAAAYNDGAWHHLVVTYGTTGGALLYVDGALSGTNSTAAAPATYNGYWHWGGNKMLSWDDRPTSDYFTGDLDELAIYPTRLTAQQVAWHYHANH